jgi:hypothetical protein
MAHEPPEDVVGRLTTAAAERRLDPNPESVAAWFTTTELLRRVASAVIACVPDSGSWQLCLEFELPRRRRRVDAVLLARDLIILVEVKAGSDAFTRAARWQIEQYALDLRDFHSGSRDRTIVPILVATSAAKSPQPLLVPEPTAGVTDIQLVNSEQTAERILTIFERLTDPRKPPLVPDEWEDSPYRPTPSIVEAARQLYESHDVRDISAADADNLDATVDAVVELVEECRRARRRGIAFITGAPGSGKTLAGLQVVHDQRLASTEETSGVFLSGNMPLVDVISSALAMSESKRLESSKVHSFRRVGTFVQHAYLFRKEYAEHEDRVPHEHVVLFDEAQRAWDSQQVTRWTRGASIRSEPRILLDVMSRLPGWCVVIAMVGGGQEINSGEAGLAEWGRALQEFHPDWMVRASEAVLPGSPERPGGRLFDELPTVGPEVSVDAKLNLVMNVRSPRAERLNQWVDSLLSVNVPSAVDSRPDPREFPVQMTRHLSAAKSWLRDRTDVDQRCGLVASAGARRLRAWGLDTKALKRERAWSDWFLRGAGDVRSSMQLEVPATNFDCQGLELDWVGICWGNDFTFDPSAKRWRMRQFRGTSWMRIDGDRARYLVNSYRVLLTRARRGQIIWVPTGSDLDPTLEPDYFDATAEFLLAAGIPSID